MKKHLLGSVALLALAVSAPAVAADMAVRPAAAPAPLRIGRDAMLAALSVTAMATASIVRIVRTGRQTSSFSPDTIQSTAFSFLAGEQLAAGSTAGFDITPRFNESGMEGGFDMGCNIQTGFWVWGFETRHRRQEFKDGQANDLAPIFNPAFISQTTERWSGTARLRLGYAVDKWMFYVTGGYAYAASGSDRME